jgi:hypothetical protein
MLALPSLPGRNCPMRWSQSMSGAGNTGIAGGTRVTVLGLSFVRSGVESRDLELAGMAMG